MKFHHIGVAVPDIEKAKMLYEQMGYQAESEMVEDSLLGVCICFMVRPDHPRIELVSPFGENSPVSRLLKETGAGPYHTCYEVKDIDAAGKDLRAQKFLPTSKQLPAKALGGRTIQFFIHKDIGLIELLACN